LSSYEIFGSVFLMMTKKNTTLPVNLWILIKRFLAIFLLFSGLTGIFLILLYYAEIRTNRIVIEDVESHSVDLQMRTITSDFNSIVSDLMFLSEQNDLQRMLESDEPEHRKALAREYLKFCERKGLYDQIRFLDETGMEAVRVNFNNGNPSIVPEEELQSKAKRYYFGDAFILGRGEVFVSPFDLNIEHGAIEQPLKPMIRFCTPVFDSHGQKRGIVVLNYLGARLIQKFKEISVNAHGTIMLLNSKGFWLIGENPEDEWGFMYEDKELHSRTFGNTFPKAWQRISKTESGQSYEANGLFTVVTVYPLEMNPSYYWKIVSYVSSELLNAHPHKLLSELLLLYAVLIVLIGAGSWILARAQIYRKQAEEELKKHRDHLEELVKERTTELTTANGQLRREIIERKRAEEELQQAKEAAEAANQAKSIFLANMSHELRTPLNAIINYSEMLIEDAQEQEQEDSIPDLQRIHVAGKHLLSIISEILDLSEIETGKMKLHLETFDVLHLIDNMVSTIQPLVEKNGNTLEIHCADSFGTIHADLAKVRQILFNLLSNACKFTEQGAITLNVTRETADGANWLTFSVTDTGIGISPEQMGKLFQAFTQVDSSMTRKFDGTGLGLAISKRFCRMMGGDISVKSELGIGTTFTIRLPVNVG